MNTMIVLGMHEDGPHVHGPVRGSESIYSRQMAF